MLNGTGQPVQPGEVGEIIARGDNITAGYLDDPESTAHTFANGVLHTGDLATVDTDGFIYIVDRQSDFIKPLGHRVSSYEIEACVLALPEVVVSAKRKKRPYLNHLFARAVVGGTYSPARSLWIRQSVGQYQLNPALQLRTADERGEQRWQPLGEVYGLDWLTQDREKVYRWRFHQYSQPVLNPVLPPWTPRQAAAARAMAPGYSRQDLADVRKSMADRAQASRLLKDREELAKFDLLVANIERGVIGALRLSKNPYGQGPDA